MSIEFVSKLPLPYFQGHYKNKNKKNNPTTTSQILNLLLALSHLLAFTHDRNIGECFLLYARDCEQMLRNIDSCVKLLPTDPQIHAMTLIVPRGEGFGGKETSKHSNLHLGQKLLFKI